ncbi:MAG TPA: hypothetical protein VFU11_00995 [Solirubrobacterales bacterium]|nr:hypothetical protein [Solirubrobacterales bacterium]
MAKDEHKMLFDLRGGRRGAVVKVVYALLAVLMGLSLFLVIGGFNLAELFSSNSSTGEAAKTYEEQAARIETKLRKDPEDPNLLLSLTRAQVNSGNAQVTVQANGTRELTTEALQEYQKANQSWSEYLKATDEPNPAIAQLMAQTLLQMAEYSRGYAEVDNNLKGAVEAQTIVAEERPSVNSLTTLAYYTYFTGDFAAAEKAKAEAKKLANGKTEEEAIDQQLAPVKKQANTYIAGKKQAEKEAKAAQKSGQAGQGQPTPETIEPGSSLFGGGGSLGE